MQAAGDTRTAVVEAAIRLIARGGLQAVTHRAVEAEAAVSHGTTTYHFGSRQKLVDAVLEHLATRDMALAGAGPVPTAVPGERHADQVAERMIQLIAGDRDYALARYELMLEAGRRPELRPSLLRWRLSFVASAEAMLRQAGAANPGLAARWLVAALDGLILDDLCAGTVDFREHAAAFVNAMLAVAVTIR